MTVLPRHALLRAALSGLGQGAAWGVVARGWMRLVSTAPEFSWAGTLFIVTLAAVFGLCVAVAAEARRQRRSRWWLLVASPAALLFAGQGMLFLPGSLAASLLMARRSVRARSVASARSAAVAMALVPVALVAVPLLVWWDLRLDEDTMLSAPLSVQVATLVGMPALGWWLAWHARDLWTAKAVVAQSDSPEPSAVVAQSDSPEPRAVDAQSDSPERARSSRRSDSSLEAPAGPA